jgi:predicted hydrocarbon binding protein
VFVFPSPRKHKYIDKPTIISWSKLEFTFNKENGVLIDKVTGERCFILPKARLEQIFARLTELFQSGAQVIIAEAFKAAGKWYINEIPEHAKTDLSTFLASAVPRFKESGLGRIEIVDFDSKKSALQFRIWNNIFAEMYYDDSTYCFGVEAYVGGLIEQLIGVAPVIHKTKCLGKGDPYCEWRLTIPQSGEKKKT